MPDATRQTTFWRVTPALGRDELHADTVTPDARLFLEVSENVEQVTCDGLTGSLPVVAEGTDSGGSVLWRRFELPLLVTTPDSPALQVLGLTLRDREHGSNRLEFEIPSALMQPGRDRQGDEAVDSDPRTAAGATAHHQICEHIDLIKSLFQTDIDASVTRDRWRGIAGGVAVPNLTRLCREWGKSGGTDPRRAVIVEIAEEHAELIEQLCINPRQVLVRDRQMVGVGRVQQIDSACLRWLARQPGRTVAEKAGPRQHVLGVVRHEDADTPENRVLRDLVRRAIVAADRYIREYRHMPDHPRVKLVRGFRRRLARLFAQSMIATVAPLVGIATPNYVLQYDTRYRKIWRDYQRLVRQQLAEDTAWRWRHRMWAEACMLGAVASMNRRDPSSTAARGELWLHGEQTHGRLVDARSASGGWHPRGMDGDIVDLIDCRRHEDRDGGLVWQFDRYPGSATQIMKGLADTAPDFVLVRRNHLSIRAVGAFWCSMQSGCYRDELSVLAAKLRGALNDCGIDSRITGVELLPSDVDIDATESVSDGNAVVAALKMPIPSDPVALDRILVEALGGSHDR